MQSCTAYRLPERVPPRGLCTSPCYPWSRRRAEVQRSAALRWNPSPKEKDVLHVRRQVYCDRILFQPLADADAGVEVVDAYVAQPIVDRDVSAMLGCA
jgi:hypothetical protein